MSAAVALQALALLNGNDRIFVDALLGKTAELHGGAGNDRDILIGGHGSDKLYGENNHDILIGGTSAFDDDEVAWAAILSE